MTTTVIRKGATGLLAGVTVLTSAGLAEASGFQLREQSAEGLGNAFAGSTAKAYNLSTIYYNPAGMTRLSGHQIGGSATWIAPVSRFSGSATGARGAATSGGSGGDAIDDAMVASTFAFWDFSPDLKFGLAMTAPFGLRSNYEKDWVGRYHALESNVTNINLTPSVAYRLTDELSIGGGLQVAYTSAKLSQALDLSSLGLPDGKATVEGDGFGIGADLGVLYEFSPSTRVGVNWRSQMSYTLDGEADYRVPSAVSALVPTLRDGDVTADLTTPDTVSIGVYHAFNPQWAVMADVAWTNWSTFDELRVSYEDGRPSSVTRENWNDTWFFSVGATYSPTEHQAIHIGVAYDQTPVPDKYRTARIPDSDRYWTSLGYSYDFGGGSGLNLGYTHIFADKASIRETTAAAGTLSGDYESHVNIVSASFVLKF